MIFAVAYVPLLVSELTTGGSELRAALEYLAAGRAGSETALPVRFVIVGLRLLSWPLTGLLTDGFLAGVVASAVVIAIAVWRSRVDGPDRLAARWLGLGLLWSTAFLTVTAPSLASIVPGLPNDHYHAFADPMVFTLVGLGAAALTAAVPTRSGHTPARTIGPILAGAGVVAFLSWNLAHLPPAIHPDGGFPAGEAAGARVDAVLTAAGVERSDAIRLQSVPDFKSTEAMVYPLARLGRFYLGDVPKGVAPGSLDPAAVTSFGAFDGLVLLCDDRFREVTGAPCGGPAETTVTPDAGGGTWGPLLERFEAAPDRFVSVYGPALDPA